MSSFGNDTAQRSELAYNFAALNVGIWNTVLYVNLVLPVAAWHEVRKSEPVWNLDKKAWLWQKEFNQASGTYVASLYGWIDGNQSKWEMYVTHEGVYTDFLWYEGEALLSAESGSWRLNHNPNNNTRYIDIEWENDVDGDYDNIKFINAIPGQAAKGSYIHYGREEGSELEIFYDIFGQEENRLIEIDYDEVSTSGRVKDNVFFGDEQWHCWNDVHQDIDCE